MVEEYPGFVENEQRRPPGESLFETMKKIGQHRGNDAGLSHQRLCLETLHVGNGEVVLGRIEQTTEWAFQRVGRERRASRRRLEQQRTRSEEHTSELQSL